MNSAVRRVAPLLVCMWVLSAPAAERSEHAPSKLEPLVKLLAEVDDAAFRLDVLKGMRAGLRGRKSVPMPESWPDVSAALAKSANRDVRREALSLGLVFGDQHALQRLREVMLDANAALRDRQEALEVLTEQRVPNLAPLLQRLLDDDEMQGPALRGLAAYRHSRTPQLIVKHYPEFDTAEKQDAIATLASRPEGAVMLLEAVGRGIVDRADVSAYTARQLEQLGNGGIRRRLRAVWGTVRRTSKEKTRLIAQYKRRLTPEVLKQADFSRGRAVFNRLCGKCHKLYGQGEAVGPDLTGSDRRNLDYILENVLDPSAVIGRDYRLHKIVTNDGRVISGIVLEEATNSIAVQTENQRFVLSREDVALMEPSAVSMMPEGQLEKLTDEEIRDLVAYLASDRQAPLPAAASK